MRLLMYKVKVEIKIRIRNNHNLFCLFTLEFTTCNKVSHRFAQIQKRSTEFFMNCTVDIKISCIIQAFHEVGDENQGLM